MSILSNGNMTSHQIGYVAMTCLIILAFLFQALCFSFNNWYRIDTGIFVLRTGLWELRIYDDRNVTGLDAVTHEQSEFRFYDPLWKSAMDRIDKSASIVPPPRKHRAKPKGPRTTKEPVARDDDPDIDSDFTDMFNDPDYNELEHLAFKPGENWFSLPKHIENTVWDQVQPNINSAETLYSISWLATFLLMCLFALHQFVPQFEVTVKVMKAFCGSLFISGFLCVLSIICYGNALPAICQHITNAYNKSPNHKLAVAAHASADCGFSFGYSLSILSSMFLILAGIMAVIRVRQLQRGLAFDLGLAANSAVSYGKSLVAGNNLNWNQQSASSAYSTGYDQQGGYQSTTQGNWERLE